MGMHPKKVNEHFFDIQSAAMWYVVGSCYTCYTPIGERGLLFKSSKYDLVEIVKDQLESEHDIVSDCRDKSSHWIMMSSVPYLNSKLGDLGLNKPKKERRFPKRIFKKYVRDLVRGIVDARGLIALVGPYERIEIAFNLHHPLLIDLHNVFVEYAKVERGEPGSDRIVYGTSDTLRIRDFIYYDGCLCLDSNKELLTADYVGKGSGYHKRVISFENIEKAKKLLVKGMSQMEVADKLGYSTRESLRRAFKRVTGQTITQFLVR